SSCRRARARWELARPVGCPAPALVGSYAFLLLEDQGQHAVLQRLLDELERRVRITERKCDLALEAAVGNLDAMDAERVAAARKRARGANCEPARIGGHGDRFGGD